MERWDNCIKNKEKYFEKGAVTRFCKQKFLIEICLFYVLIKSRLITSIKSLYNGCNTCSDFKILKLYLKLVALQATVLSFLVVSVVSLLFRHHLLYMETEIIIINNSNIVLFIKCPDFTVAS